MLKPLVLEGWWLTADDCGADPDRIDGLGGADTLTSKLASWEGLRDRNWLKLC